jgi:hypothetical protein
VLAWNSSVGNELQRLKEPKIAEDFIMDATQIQIYARQLFEAQGSKAIAAAAQRALMLEHHNDIEQAQAWRRIEAALILMRGPRET